VKMGDWNLQDVNDGQPKNDGWTLQDLTITDWNADDEMNDSCHYNYNYFKHKYNNSKNTTHSKCVLMFSTNAKFSRRSYNALRLMNS